MYFDSSHSDTPEVKIQEPNVSHFRKPALQDKRGFHVCETTSFLYISCSFQLKNAMYLTTVHAKVHENTWKQMQNYLR